MAGRTIVITAAEACPYAYVGDLGTTVSSLAEALSSAGHTVHLFIPRYASVFSGSRAFTRHEKKLEVRYPGHEYDAALYTDTVSASFHIHAIEHNLFFERDSIYGPPYSDNCERFSFFSHALFHALDLLDIKPDIIHCFDWHTALVPVLARTLYDTSRIRFAAVVLTIHSIRHTGIFPASAVTVTGLSWDAVTEDNMKYYTQISLLKGGMQYADLLSTVSVTYAKDIINPAESGHLAGIVYAKGIVPVNSGFSAGGWDPSQDKKIDALFSMSDMAGKRVCKTALQRHFGLPLDDDAALFGLTGPFTRENMMPQAARIIGYTAARSRVQFVLMGDGDDDTFLLLEYLNSIMPDRVHIHRGRDE
ncbi:MAG: glycogen synthase, partial [Spirochaetota bacterium]